MPLYVARWPNLSAALVRAENEDKLIDILDEIGNPDGCTWAEYRGPLFLDFELTARSVVDVDDAGRALPLDPERIRVEGVDELAAGDQDLMTVGPCAETGAAMIKAICGFAFPATAAVYWGNDCELDPEELECALKEDAMRLVEHTWRHSHLRRSSDPDAQLAIAMDASLQWIGQQRQQTADVEDGGYVDELEQEPRPTEDIADMLDMTRAHWIEHNNARAVRRMLLDALQWLEEVAPDVAME